MTTVFKALLLFIAGGFIIFGSMRSFGPVLTDDVDHPKKGDHVKLHLSSVFFGRSIFSNSNFWIKIGQLLKFILGVPYRFFNWVYILFARVEEPPKWMKALSGISTVLIWFHVISAWLFSWTALRYLKKANRCWVSNAGFVFIIFPLRSRLPFFLLGIFHLIFVPQVLL